MREGLLRTLAEKVDPAHTALLLVDFQNDFCAPKGGAERMGLDVSPVERCIDRALALLEVARETGLLVIFVQAIYDEVFQADPGLELKERQGRSLLCLSGTPGADFYRIERRPSEHLVQKHRYSAFVGTDLEQILHARGIRTLVVTGVTTHVCVESTVRDAFLRDYYVVIPDDCVWAPDEAIHQGSLRNMDRYFGQVVPSQAIVAAWQAVGAAMAAGR